MLALSLRNSWGAWPRCLGLLLTWCCLLVGNKAAAQSWQKAVVASATGSYHVTATAADAAGNVYIAGVVVSSATFGTTTLTNPNTPPGGGNVFIAKWSSSANTFVWAYLVSGNGGSATALALNGTNVYLAGSISTFNFGGLTFSGGNGGFVARLTDAGASASFVWVRRAGTTGVKAMAVQGTSVFVTGGFLGTEVFGSTTLVSTGVGTDEDIFVAKLVDTGPGTNFVWVQQGGSISMDAAYALAVEGANVYVAGNFSGATATFGSTTLTNPNVPSVPVRTRLFIAKLTDAGTSGSFEWAQQAGSGFSDKVNAIAVTGGNVYVVGLFLGQSFTFGPFILSATNNSSVNIFMVKLTDAGTSSSFGWAQRIGSGGYEEVTGLASTATGVYVSGYFLSPTISFGATTLTRTGGSDIFVAKLLDAGATSSFDWVQQAVGGNSNAGNVGTKLAVVGKAVYIAGDLTPPVTFGSQTITGSSSSVIGFWAQLFDNSLVLAAAAPQPWARAEVYPNPARTSTHVQLPAVSGPTPATLTLRDALGRTVHRQQLLLSAALTGAEVPLQGLVPGLYHLQLQAGDLRTNYPLVVE